MNFGPYTYTSGQKLADNKENCIRKFCFPELQTYGLYFHD